MARLCTKSLVSTLALGIALVHAQRASAQALPTGASVARGTVSVGTPSNGSLAITQTSARAIVNWQGFDVGPGGTVTITQPDKSSALLSRVGGSRGTTIDGSIQSNGQVFLINLNGITISSTGVIKAGGGFVASSLDIADDDFMAGRLNFSGTTASGAVRNAGHITSDNGFVALIGTSVSNSGTITSNLGRVALAAATSATLDLNGDGFLQVLLPTDASDANGTPLVDQSGTIVVNGGRVRLLASVAANAVRQAVNLSGTIQADSVSGVAGDVLLQTVGGGDIYGTYLTDGAFYGPTVTPASLSAKGGSVRLDAAGSLQLFGTQANAASISAVAGQDITIDQTPAEVGNVVNPRFNATGSTRIVAAGAASLTKTELNVGGSGTYQGSRIDISGQRVQIYDITANAPSGLIRIGGAFRDNATDDGSADFQYFVGRLLQNGATSLPYLPLSGSLYGLQSNALNAPGGAIVLASVMPYIGQSTISISPASALNPVSLAIDFRNSNGVGSLSGVLGSLSGRADLDHLWIGAPSITIGDDVTRPYGSALYLNRRELSGLDASTLTIEGANGLTISAPVSFTDYLLSYRFQYYDGSGALHVVASGGPEASQLPQVGSVNAGTAALSYTHSGLIVTQTSDRAVIDWQSFNIASGFSAAFNLPTATSAILNRVSASAGVSTIAGTISSNGQVFLVNPNGVVIGSGGVVSATGGFTASSLSLANNAFMAGTLAWGANPSAGGISNAGSITASNATVALLGGTITNTGTIATGTGGTVSLIASGAGTVNVGQASGGTLQLGAQDVTIGTVAGANGLSLAPTAALGLFANFGTVSIEAGNDLTIANDLGVSIGTLSGLSFSAGRSLTVSGQLRAGGTALSLVADSGTAALGLAGARRSGAATLDLSGAALGSSNSIAVSLAGASGITGEVIKLAPIRAANVAGNLSISAASGDAIRFGGNVAAGGTIALTGSLQFAADTIVSAPNLSWDAATGDTVSGFANGTMNFTAAAALVNGGTTLFRGTLQDGVATRIALDGFAPGNANITYGDDANGIAATMALHVVSGALKTGDTLASLLAPGEIGISGGAAGRRDVGTYSVSLNGPTGTASAGDKAGYFFDLRLPTTNSFTVTAKPVTYSVATAQSIYGTVATAIASLTGVLSGDSVTGTVSALRGATSSSLIAPLNAGSYALKVTGLSGASAGNYVIATSGDTTGTLTVAPLTIGATVLNATSTYGTAAILGNARLSGVLSGDQVSGTEALRIGGALTAPSDRLNAGGYAITVAGLTGSAAANYTLGSITDALLTVAPKTVQLSLASSGYTYGSPTSVASLSGVLSGDAVSLSGTLDSFGTTLSGTSAAYMLPDRTAAGAHQLAITGLVGGSAGNYAIDPASGRTLALTIIPKTVTYAAGIIAGTYGDYTSLVGSAGGIQLDGVLAGDDVSGIGAVDPGTGLVAVNAHTAAGSYVYQALLSGMASGNYVLATTGNTFGRLTLRQRHITASIPDTQSTYGTLPALTVTLNNIVAGDDVHGAATLLDTTGYATTFDNRLEAGQYRITADQSYSPTTGLTTPLTGSAAGNYIFDSGSTATLIVVPKPISAALIGATYTYGSPVATIALNGIVAGDTITPNASLDGSATTIASDGSGYDLATKVNAGTHQINVTSISGTRARDYTLVPVADGTVTITPRLLTWSVANASSTYGDLVAPPVIFGNLLAGDSVAATYLANGSALVARTSVGTYTAAVGGLTGASAGNYALSTTGDQTGLLAISPRPITYVLGQQSSTYGDLAALGVSFANEVAGDSLSGTVTVSQSGAPVTLTDRSNAGTYQLGFTGLTGPDAADYTLSGGTAGTLTIGKRTVSLTPDNISSVYGTLASPTGTFSAVLAGDQLTPEFAIYEFGQASPITAGLDAYSYPIGGVGIGGASAGNYQLDSVRTATLTVTPKPITVALASQSATYGSISGLASQPITLDGVLAADRSQVWSSTSIVLNGLDPSALLNAGTYTIAVGGLQGVKGFDYTYAPGSVTTATLTINPVGIGTAGALSTIYGNLTSFSGVGIYSTSTGALNPIGLSADRVLLSRGQAFNYVNTTDVGTYQIGLANLLLNGQPTTNYVIDPAQTASLTIKPRTVYTGGTTNYIYGNVGRTATLSPTGADAFVAGDDIRIVMAMNGAFSSSGFADAGHYAGAAQLAGTRASNYLLYPGSQGDVIVSARPLTATLTGAATRAYGDAGSATTALTGLIAGDSVGVTSALGDGSDVNAAKLFPGTYSVTATVVGADAGNYSLTSPQVGSITITKRPIWFDAAGLTQSYGSISTPVLDNVLPGDIVGANSTLLNLDGTRYSGASIASAGHYKLSGTLQNLADFYVLQAPGGGGIFDFTIAPRVLNFSGSTSLTYSYQTSNSALQSLFSGLLSQDVNSIAPIYTGLNGSATIAQNGHPDAGTYALAISALGGSAGGNYVLGTNAATLTINPLTISWSLGGGNTYGNVLTSSDLAVYKDTIGGEQQTIGNRTGTVGRLIGIPLAYAGDVQIDASIVGTGALVGQFTDAGTYQLASPVLIGASAKNFRLAATPFSSATPYVVSPRTISFTASGGTSAYAGLTAAPTASISLNGVLNGDTVQPILGFETAGGGSVTQFAVGTYYAAAVGVTGAKAGDYRVSDWRQTATDGSLSNMAAYTITPRVLTVSPISTYSYGDTLDLLSLLTGTDATLAATDGISLGVGLTSGSFSLVSALDAGSYTARYQLGGSLSVNYALASGSSASRTITINPRTIGYSIAPVTSIYGETPTYAATLTNTLAGRAMPLYALAATQDGAATQLAQAGQLDVGNYFARVIGLSGEKSSNYLFQPVAPTTGATTIVPRSVTLNQAMTSIYGDIPAASTAFSQKSGTTGLVNGDILTATMGLSSGAIGTLKVGDWSYDTLTLGGAKLQDYSVSLTGSKTLTITPRTLSYQLYTGAVYGDGSPVVTLGNVVNGDSVQPIVHSFDANNTGTEIAGAHSGVTTYVDPYREIGTYSYALYGLVGADAANYVLPFRIGSMPQVGFTITPRPITAQQILASGAYYSTFQPVGWNNILANDDINGAVDPIVANLSAGVPNFTAGRVFGTDTSGTLVRLDVGSYQFQVTGLAGSRAANYSLVAPLTFTLAITPVSFTFSLDTQGRYYGNQIEVCDNSGNNCAMQADTKAFYTLGTQRFATDDVNATIALTDASGKAFSYTATDKTLAYDSGLNAGTYAISITGLVGAQAKNYYIPTDYTKALTIAPAVIGYKIDPGAGFYFKGVGFVGAPSSTTLNGVYGSDKVSVVLGGFAGSDANSVDAKLYYPDLNLIPKGTDHLQVVGLVSSDNYVLGKPGGTWGAGALITVNDTSFFNLGLASLATTTTISYQLPTTPPVATSPSATGNTKSASSSDPAFKDLTGTSTSASTTAYGAGASASATTGGQATADLGNGVTSNSRVQATTAVGASAGPTGVAANASASFTDEERIIYGPGYSAIGAEAAASGSASFSLVSLSPGLTFKGRASLDLYQLQGVSGGLGNGATGTLEAKTTEGASAEGKAQFGLKDGTFATSFKGAAGVGVSAGITGGVSGATGSIGGGATVYSPGQVAAGFEPSVGYSDGKLNVGLSLTAALGFGGISLDLNFAIDFNAVGEGVNTMASAFGSAMQGLMGGGCDTACHSQERLGNDMKTLTALNPLTDADKIIAMLTPGSSSAIGSKQDIDLLLGQSSLSPGSVYDYAGKLAGAGGGLLTAAKTANEAKQEIPEMAKQQQALIQKFVANPGGFTAADYAAIQQASADFQTEMTKINVGLSGANIHLEAQGNTLVPVKGGIGPKVDTQAAIEAIKTSLSGLHL